MGLSSSFRSVCLIICPARNGVGHFSSKNKTPHVGPIVNRDEDTSKTTDVFHAHLCTNTTTLSTHTHQQPDMDLPCSSGPKCSAAGDGGGEGGKLVESSTAYTQKTKDEDEKWI